MTPEKKRAHTARSGKKKFLAEKIKTIDKGEVQWILTQR
jgi:hypothetical protein